MDLNANVSVMAHDAQNTPDLVAAQAAHNDEQDSVPYETPKGAEHRTFEFSVGSSCDLWLITTFTGWAGERLWVSAPLPFGPTPLKLTFRQDSLELPEVRWLVERVLRLAVASQTLTGASTEERGEVLRQHVLDKLVRLVDQYLSEFDLQALLWELSSLPSSVRARLLDGQPPSSGDGLPAYEAYLCAAFDCIKLTYCREDNYRRQPSTVGAA